VAKPTCSIEGCARPSQARGFCSSHYSTWWKKNKHATTKYGSAEDRFWAKVEKSDGCWVWTAATRTGYGLFCPTPTRPVMAHRFAYELLVAPIPVGLELDHLCRTPLCVNPAHLEPVTHRENCLRGTGASARNAVKTECPHGHAYDDENTYVDRTGNRHCRVCRRANDLKRRPRGVPRKVAA
jgi:hypothetical protein